MKKKLLKTTCTKKLEKVSKFLNIIKAYKYKAKFFPANRASRCSQNNRQIMKSMKLVSKNRKKPQKLQKN